VPKELFEINRFESGNVYNPDDRDIPDDAAVYSENIDPYGQAGSLQAIQEDATAIKAGVDTRRMSMINDDGTYRLVYVDRSDFDIKKIDDVYGTPSSVTTLESGTFGTDTSIAAQQVNNKEVHMGLGKTRDPKWVGIIPHKQFGGSTPSGLQVDNAELRAPSPFSNMHTVVNDSSNNFCYTIKENGTYVYKFDVSTGKLVKRSDYFFTKTKAMCLASDGNLWVADEISNDLTILKIDPDNMDILSTRPLSNFTGDTSVTDIAEQGDYLWLAKGHNNAAVSVLWNVATANLTTSSSSQAVEDRTPWAGASGGTPTTGDWALITTDHASETGIECEVKFRTTKLPLMIPSGSTNYIGLTAHVVKADSAANVRWHYGSSAGNYLGYYSGGGGTSYGNIMYFLMLVKFDNSSGDKLTSNSGAGTVFAYHADFDSAYNETYLTKSTSNSTYLNFISKGSASTNSDLQRVSKPSVTGVNTAVLGRTVSASNQDIEAAIGDETSGTYNIFSSAGQARWGTSTGGAISIKLSGEVDFTITDNSSVAGSIDTGKDYFYATSFLYDGYQESPLSSWEFLDHTSIGEDSLNIKIDIYPSGLSKRVTHINIYRSDTGVNDAEQPSSFFRLVKSVSLKNGWQVTDTNTSNPDWGNYYTKTIIDHGASYASYESRTGISEAVINTLPKYGLSAKINNYLYISDCSHEDIDNATNYIFKSRPFNFDQFNWAKDFLLLPSKPVALESFNGRLYAFSENSIYVINPDGMYIEDTLEGIGCRNQNSVVVSDIGMCWMDYSSIYYYDGKSINDIAQQIKYSEQHDDLESRYSSMEYLTSFSDSSYYDNILVAYDGFRKSFYFFYTRKNSSQYFPHTLVYTVPKNRWDVWTRENGLSGGYGIYGVYSSIVGKNNQVLISDTEHGLIQPFDPKNDTRKSNFKWYSKKFTMGDSTVDKKFFKVEALSEDSTPTITVNTAENSSSYAALSTPTKARHLQIKVDVNDSTSIIDALRIVYRKLKKTKSMS
tara:strand:- start:14201 stop:17215 length:3015 start_codon:yes stop_codon:yes gene_type:complete